MNPHSPQTRRAMPDTAPSPIHPSAHVDPSAELAPGVQVGPYATVGPGVSVGEGCEIGPYATIVRNTRLGRANVLYHHAVLGADSQDLKYRGGRTWLEIGDGNVFREFVTVSRATGEGRATRIGNGSLLLAYSHVAHDCRIGDGVIIANGSQLGGEVEIEDHAALGGLVGVHQFCRVGAHAFVGACSKLTQDLAPYLTADGHPARPRGLNTVGLRRRGFADETIARLKTAYRRLFLKGLPLEQALEAVARDCAGSPEIERLIDFIRGSSRGIARPRTGEFRADDSRRE